MMKKILLSIFIIVVALSSVHSALIPVQTEEKDSLLSSPALAIKAQHDINIGIKSHMGSDFSALSFMSNPVHALEKSAKYISEKLAAIDNIEFWKANQDLISIFSSLDPENFPTDMKNESLFIYNIQSYFRTHFLSKEYGNINRAHAVNMLSSSHPELFSQQDADKMLGGDLNLGFNLYGRHAKDGFAWAWDVSLGYLTPPSLLTGEGKLELKASVDCIYAFNIFTQNLSFGISAQPSIFFNNVQLGSAFINSRMENNAIGIFTEPMRFGTGININAGLLWNVNEELAFTLDFRNIPSFKSYFEWDLVSLAEGNLMPERDRNLYYEAPDIAIASSLEKDKITLKVEIANILNQLIWANQIKTYDFDYYQVVDLYFGYNLTDDLMLATRLGKEKLSLEVKWKELECALTTKLDKGYLGLSIGYNW